MYSALEDIYNAASERTVAQLTDDESGSVVDEDVVTEAIAAADELIDANIRGRYELPLPETPPILKRLSVSIALFNLYSRRPEGDLPDTVSMRYRDAMRALDGIRDGKLTLGTPEGEAAPEGSVYKTNKTPQHKRFTDDDNDY